MMTVSRSRLVWAVLIGVVAAAHVDAAESSQTITYTNLVQRMTSLERLAEPVPEGETTGASTSHDRGSTYDAATDTYHNWSANDDGHGFIRREGEGQVLVDLQGPGVLWRIWSAMPEAGDICIYLDGNEKPVIEKPFRGYFDDLERDYPALAPTLSRGRNAYIPIPFARSCKVVLKNGWGAYFHCTHTLFAPGTKVETFPGFTPEVQKQLAAANNAWARPGAVLDPGAKAQWISKTLTIAPGKQSEITRDGAGAVVALRVRPIGLPEDRIAQEDALREMTLSLYWDGETTPSAWAPLGDFFATSPGLNEFKTRPMGCIDGTFYSYWYMPFAKGMRLVIGNDGEAERKVEVELETVPLEATAATKLLRFCAAWHADDFTGLKASRFMQKGGDRWPDWPLLVVKGRGRFVGMSEHIWKFGGWWGEGDEKFFVDGEKFPSTIGTGSEDYIGYAWAADPPFITFNSATAACSRIRPDAQEDTSVCRFHLCDDIPFRTGFEGFIEVMPNRDCRPALYDTCVYWYREQGATNPYPPVPLAARRLQRPAKNMKSVLPITIDVPKPKPGVLEGEDMEVLSMTSGKHWLQDMAPFPDGKWSGDSHLIWTDGRLGDAIELEFNIEKAGRQKLFAALTRASDYGIFELSIDGQPIDRYFDCYDERVTSTGELPLGEFDLAAGKHVLKAKLVGQNPKARPGANLFGLDMLRVQPAGQ
jgi:hypothetical protein